MPEKIGKELIKREKGFLYYVKDGDVWQCPMKGKTGEKKKISKEKVTIEKGFMYFVGKSGYVERAPRKAKGSGGAKKEKKAEAPKKKADAPKKKQ